MARSYEILPMGLPVPAADVAAWGTARVAQAFALGFSLAAPFVIAAFAYNLALGAINRAMPQLMVAFIGAPAITAGGLLILMLAAPVILHFWIGRMDLALADPLGAAAVSEDESGGGEKVFDPTPQKLAEARRKGDIPRSSDVTAAATYLGFLAVVATAGAFGLSHAASVLMIFIAEPDRLERRDPRAGRARALGGGSCWRRCRRWRRSSWCRSARCWSACSRSRRSPSPATSCSRRWSRLSLIANAKRKFGAAGLVEFAKAAIKLAAIGDGALLLSRARSRPDDRRLDRRGAGARRHDDAVAGGAADDHLRDRGDDRRDRPGLAALRPRAAAQDVLPGHARGGAAVGRRSAHEGAAAQPGRGDRHQPDAARRADGGRDHRQPDALRGGAEMVAGARAARRSASPRAKARWRCGSARWRRSPGCRCTATRRRRGRCTPRSRSAARSRRSITARSRRRSASPTGCAGRRGRGGGRDAGGAAPARGAGRGAAGAGSGAAGGAAGGGPRGWWRRSRGSRAPRRAIWRKGWRCRWRGRGCGRPGRTRRMRAARRRRGELAARIRAARAEAVQSLGKHEALEALVERADRAAAQLRIARAEREAPAPAGQGLRCGGLGQSVALGQQIQCFCGDRYAVGGKSPRSLCVGEGWLPRRRVASERVTRAAVSGAECDGWRCDRTGGGRLHPCPRRLRRRR